MYITIFNNSFHCLECNSILSIEPMKECLCGINYWFISKKLESFSFHQYINNSSFVMQGIFNHNVEIKIYDFSEITKQHFPKPFITLYMDFLNDKPSAILQRLLKLSLFS